MIVEPFGIRKIIQIKPEQSGKGQKANVLDGVEK